MVEELTFARITAIYRHEKDHRTLIDLDEDFYGRLARHMESLRAELARERDAGGSARGRILEDEIAKTEKKRDQIFTERERKLALLASAAAAGTPGEVKGLAREERELLEHLVALLRGARAKAFGHEAVPMAQTPPPQAKPASPAAAPTPPRALADVAVIRVLQDVPPFAGLAGTYHLHRGDVLTLPRSLADVLCARGKAQEIAVPGPAAAPK